MLVPAHRRAHHLRHHGDDRPLGSLPGAMKWMLKPSPSRSRPSSRWCEVYFPPPGAETAYPMSTASSPSRPASPGSLYSKKRRRGPPPLPAGGAVARHPAGQVFALSWGISGGGPCGRRRGGGHRRVLRASSFGIKVFPAVILAPASVFGVVVGGPTASAGTPAQSVDCRYPSGSAQPRRSRPFYAPDPDPDDGRAARNPLPIVYHALSTSCACAITAWPICTPFHLPHRPFVGSMIVALCFCAAAPSFSCAIDIQIGYLTVQITTR